MGADRMLVVIGLACLAASGLAWGREQAFQRAVLARLARAEESESAAAPLRRGDVVGALKIPRLDVTIGVIEGDDAATLSVAAGHLPDTPLPWAGGNSALAGHRDTVFRALQDLRVGDELWLETLAHGTLRYRVRDMRVVEPDDLSVLAPSVQPQLTLITCHPFTYIGPAPRRFVVRAERL